MIAKNENPQDFYTSHFVPMQYAMPKNARIDSAKSVSRKLKTIKIISLVYKFARVTIFSVFSPSEDALKQIGRQQPTEMEKRRKEIRLQQQALCRKPGEGHAGVGGVHTCAWAGWPLGQLSGGTV